MGETIGRYVVRKRLRRTKFSRLVLVEDRGLGRLAAAKIFNVDASKPPKPFGHDEWLARFEAEARVMARLDHPNIVQVWDFGRLEEGRFYLVMPFLAGTLPKLIGKDFRDGEDMSGASEADLPRALPWREAARILAGVFAALAHLHARGIVHRDVKADNLLMTRSGGTPRLCDFGMARIGPARDSRKGKWIGSEDYISPEQFEDSGGVTDRADVYSAGVLAYRMLSGRLPDGDAPLLSALADIPGALERLVAECMAREPERRPSADEAGRRLAAVLAPIKARTTIRVGVNMSTGHGGGR